MTPDPWLVVAKAILNGDFDPIDHSTQQSLIIGLRANPDQTAQKALAKVKAAKPFVWKPGLP